MFENTLFTSWINNYVHKLIWRKDLQMIFWSVNSCWHTIWNAAMTNFVQFLCMKDPGDTILQIDIFHEIWVYSFLPRTNIFLVLTQIRWWLNLETTLNRVCMSLMREGLSDQFTWAKMPKSKIVNGMSWIWILGFFLGRWLRIRYQILKIQGWRASMAHALLKI